MDRTDTHHALTLVALDNRADQEQAARVVQHYRDTQAQTRKALSEARTLLARKSFLSRIFGA